MDELERYGRPYWKCQNCEYGSFIKSSTEAHIRDHEVRPTLESLAAESAPVEAPAPAPTTRSKRRS